MDCSCSCTPALSLCPFTNEWMFLALLWKKKKKKTHKDSIHKNHDNIWQLLPTNDHMYCVSYGVSYRKGCNSINDAANSIPFLSHEYSKGFFSSLLVLVCHSKGGWSSWCKCISCMCEIMFLTTVTPAWPLTPNWSCHKCAFTDLLFWLSLVKINLSILTCWQKEESCRRRRRGGRTRRKRRGRRGKEKRKKRRGRRSKEEGEEEEEAKRRRKKKKRQYTQYKILWCIIVFSSFWALHQPHILTLT